MKNLLKITVLLSIVLSLSSCAALKNFMAPKQAAPLDYIEGGNKMDIKKFFDGNVEAFAIKQNSEGKIIGTVTVKISGKWEENKGTIQQNFTYSDGSKDNRTWLVTLNSDGSFDAIGHDVVMPVKGKQIGNAAQSVYSLMIGNGADKTKVNFDDRMYLIDDKSLIMISDFNSKKDGKNDAGKIIFSLKKSAN